MQTARIVVALLYIAISILLIEPSLIQHYVVVHKQTVVCATYVVIYICVQTCVSVYCVVSSR